MGKKILKIICGLIFLVIFILSVTVFKKEGFLSTNIREIISLIVLAISICFFIPSEILDGKNITPKAPENRRFSKRTIVSAIISIIIIPATLLIGTYVLKDKKYYFISLLVIIETLLPFFLRFESRKPEAKELVILSALCAIAVCGRGAFFMLPQFKPVAAIVIIAGVCFGGEAGFLTGAISGFVSNFFFGQGPWTPWQMFAFGLIGFFAGVFFKKGFLKKTRLSLAIFGGLATLIIYGGIMNPASVITWQPQPTKEMIVSSYVMGFPFDLVHAVSSIFFLWIGSGAMIEKLERIKTKYGILDI